MEKSQVLVVDIARAFSVDRNVVDKRLSRGRQYLKENLVFWKGECSDV